MASALLKNDVSLNVENKAPSIIITAIVQGFGLKNQKTIRYWRICHCFSYLV